MRVSKVAIFWLLATVAALALVMGGCATMEKEEAAVKKEVLGKKGPATFPCASRGNLVRATTPDAKLVKLECFFKKYDMVDHTLHFKVTLKNVSDKPQRFRVNIFLDNDKAVGGLIPRKTKKGLVAPGKTASFTYPVKGMTTKPKSVTLIVKTVSQ